MIIPKSLKLIDSEKSYNVTFFTHGFKNGANDITGESEDNSSFKIRF
jgi:hypothetical protein